jgi:CubicO group peptidase (beta-lactamase class C family)
MNTIKRSLVVLVGLLAFGEAGCARQGLSNKIKDLVEAEARYAYFSGTALVAKDDRVIYAGAFGYANRNFQVPNTLATKFNIGSITKTFTALAVLQLMEQGKIKAEDPLGEFLPDCPVPEKNDITIHHLLTHTSGLYDFANSEVIFEMLYKRSIDEMIPYVYGQGLLFRPGADVSYSSGGFVLLGAVIEKVSGMPFGRYLLEKILKPAGMDHTGLLAAEDVSPDKATGYKQLDRETYLDRTLWHFPGSSAGGIYTTAEDLFRYVRALRDKKLLSAEYLDLLLSPKTKETEQGRAAYGWWVETMGNQEAIGHRGGTPGFSSSIYMFPGPGYAAIVLSNSWRGNTGLTDQINSALTGREYEIADPNTYNLRKGIDLYYDGRSEDAIPLFDEILRSAKPSRRAYYYAGAARIAEKRDLPKAVEYLDRYIRWTDPKWNSSLAGGWFQKGCAYENMKDLDKAIQCYNESLNLDPGNDQAKAALAKLKK